MNECRITAQSAIFPGVPVLCSGVPKEGARRVPAGAGISLRGLHRHPAEGPVHRQQEKDVFDCRLRPEAGTARAGRAGERPGFPEHGAPVPADRGVQGARDSPLLLPHLGEQHPDPRPGAGAGGGADPAEL